MFEMINYILYFSLSRNNRRLQEFQSTYRQGIIRTVAYTDAAVTNMHFYLLQLLLAILRGKYMHTVKGALSGLRQFLATESPLKMMKNASYFTLRALFILKIFKFLL